MVVTELTNLTELSELTELAELTELIYLTVLRKLTTTTKKSQAPPFCESCEKYNICGQGTNVATVMYHM